MTSLSNKYCESGLKRESENPLSSNLDGQLESIHNISDEITSQLKLNVSKKIINY